MSALPILFGTGINTYLWILSTKKPEDRKGMIQLIDASDMKTSLRKNMGNKRFEISEEQRQWIIETYINGYDHDKSVLVPYETFMYRKVTTQRPLRMMIQISRNKFDEFKEIPAISKLSEDNLVTLMQGLEVYASSDFEGIAPASLQPYEWADKFAREIRGYMSKVKAASQAQIAAAVRKVFGVKSQDFDIVYDKYSEIMADPDLKDTENIPFGTSFDEYMQTEVLPYAPETWIDETVVDKGPLQDGKVGIIGTNISFNKFFYHYEEPRKPDEIAKEIMELENDLEGFLKWFLI